MGHLTQEGFKVSKDLTLPREFLSWVITILAKRNAGKTYNAGVLTEKIISAQVPTMILDGMGTWWGLRVGVDAEGRPDPTKEGLPVVVIGGRHADIQLDSSKVEKIVEALLQTNTSAVLDLSQFRKGEQTRIAMIFAEEVYRLADKYPAERVIVVEETEMFAPQRPFREEARCLGAFEDLVKRGGNRNLCFIGITQRAASYNKNLLTQSDMLIIGRITAPQDKEAIQAWVEKHAEEDKKELATWYDSLSGLKKGQMWVWNDDDEYPIKKLVQFRKRRTFHATRKFVLSKQAVNVKLGDASQFIERFKDKFEPKPKPTPSEPKPRLPPLGDFPTRKIEVSRPVSETMTVPVEPPVTLKRGEAYGAGLVDGKVVTVKLPPTHTGSPEIGIEQTFVHQVPNVSLLKERPTIQVPTEPSSPLGKVLVVLTNNKQLNDWRWTGKKIKNLIRAHEWPEDGADEAIAELTRMELLVKQSNNYLHFNRGRVHVIEHDVVREAA